MRTAAAGVAAVHCAADQDRRSGCCSSAAGAEQKAAWQPDWETVHADYGRDMTWLDGCSLSALSEGSSLGVKGIAKISSSMGG